MILGSFHFPTVLRGSKLQVSYYEPEGWLIITTYCSTLTIRSLEAPRVSGSGGFSQERAGVGGTDDSLRYYSEDTIAHLRSSFPFSYAISGRAIRSGSNFFILQLTFLPGMRPIDWKWFRSDHYQKGQGNGNVSGSHRESEECSPEQSW